MPRRDRSPGSPLPYRPRTAGSTLLAAAVVFAAAWLTVEAVLRLAAALLGELTR